MIPPSQSEGPHVVPPGSSDVSAMYAIAYVPPITAHSDADGRPDRLTPHNKSQPSAATPVTMGTTRYSKCSLVVHTSTALIVKTKVSEPGRSLNALFKSRPVPARIAVCPSMAAMSLSAATQRSAYPRNTYLARPQA